MATEHERAELLHRHRRNYGDQLARQYAPGSVGYHELQDRSFLAAEFWDTFIREHPACVTDAELFAAASDVAEAVDRFYQRVAQLAWAATPPTAPEENFCREEDAGEGIPCRVVLPQDAQAHGQGQYQGP